MNHYETLSPELEARIQADRAAGWQLPAACPNAAAIRRRDRVQDVEKIWRPPFSKDADKILNSAFYNRYADKTQVFSFYRNDDLCRRALHVQLVSRIARNIGAVLGLNLDLIEAIAVGHDMGHTPFGHAGEKALQDLYLAHTGRYFFHHLHGVRVLDTMIPYNISLQTLDGILCHNGELPRAAYDPQPCTSFAAFDARVAQCYQNKDATDQLVPATLEGCLVRICDIIAYLGKDRQDAVRAHLTQSEMDFPETCIGKTNAEVINNLEVNLIEMSYGKPYLMLDEAHFSALEQLKAENMKLLYQQERVQKQVRESVVPMMERLYEQIRADAVAHRKESYLYRHHIAVVEEKRRWYPNEIPYAETAPDDLAVDFLAAMTDDYFVDYYETLFPKDAHHISYVGYFDE